MSPSSRLRAVSAAIALASLSIVAVGSATSSSAATRHKWHATTTQVAPAGTTTCGGEVVLNTDGTAKTCTFDDEFDATTGDATALDTTKWVPQLTANSNFLDTMRYALEDIKGEHHRMFCETEFAASMDYKRFWQKLNRGEFDSGRYKRVGNGGKQIWIQATYNPILDLNGKPFKIVKFATDITEQVLME